MDDSTTLTAGDKRKYQEIAARKCCNSYCLLNKVNNPPGTMDYSVRLIKQCRDEIRIKTRKETYTHIENIVRNSCKRLLDSNIWEMNFAIGWL